MKTKFDIQGYEYDWLAVDSDGHVGLFSTAGGGFAPQPFLADIEAADIAIERILALAPTSAVACNVVLAEGLINTWRLVGERGIFAFDSDSSGGPYKLIAKPRRPVLISELPMDIRVVASRVSFAALRFFGSTVIAAEQLVAEKASGRCSG